jgi:hypothetical protein
MVDWESHASFLVKPPTPVPGNIWCIWAAIAKMHGKME